MSDNVADEKYLDVDGTELRVGDEVEGISTRKRYVIHELYWSHESRGNFISKFRHDGIPPEPTRFMRLVRRGFRVGDVVRDPVNDYMIVVQKINSEGQFGSGGPYFQKSFCDRCVVIGHIDLPEPDPNPWPEMEFSNHVVELNDNRQTITIGCQTMQFGSLPYLIKIFQQALDWKKREDAKND